MSLEEMSFVEQSRHLKSNTQVTKVVINEDGIEKKIKTLKKLFPPKKLKINEDVINRFLVFEIFGVLSRIRQTLVNL